MAYFRGNFEPFLKTTELENKVEHLTMPKVRLLGAETQVCKLFLDSLVDNNSQPLVTRGLFHSIPSKTDEIKENENK